MDTYNRKYPLYSLCGLNCGICPNYHSDKSFQCSGCGGKNFYAIHPKCSIITCSTKHNNIEFCFLCEEYPCEKYKWINENTVYDSFITYQNVVKDVNKVKNMGIDSYYSELEEKTGILKYLLKNYNAGRQKTFFCLAMNLLELDDIKGLLLGLKKCIDPNDTLINKSKIALALFNNLANEKNVILKLHKKK